MSIYFDAVKEDARKTLLKSKFILPGSFDKESCHFMKKMLLEVSLCCHSNVL